MIFLDIINSTVVRVIGINKLKLLVILIRNTLPICMHVRTCLRGLVGVERGWGVGVFVGGCSSVNV